MVQLAISPLTRMLAPSRPTMRPFTLVLSAAALRAAKPSTEKAARAQITNFFPVFLIEFSSFLLPGVLENETRTTGKGSFGWKSRSRAPPVETGRCARTFHGLRGVVLLWASVPIILGRSGSQSN